MIKKIRIIKCTGNSSSAVWVVVWLTITLYLHKWCGLVSQILIYHCIIGCKLTYLHGYIFEIASSKLEEEQEKMFSKRSSIWQTASYIDWFPWSYTLLISCCCLDRNYPSNLNNRYTNLRLESVYTSIIPNLVCINFRSYRRRR